MLRLGPALLTALLLGVPRALGGRAFGQRAVYVEVAGSDARLRAFGDALARAVDRYGARLAEAWDGQTAVITVHGLTRVRTAAGEREIVSLSLGEGRLSRPLMLHYAPGSRVAAARALLESLSA